MPAGDLLLPTLEVKVRHVRTPQGSRKYKKPIGAEIPAGATRVHGAFLTQALPRGWHLYRHTSSGDTSPVNTYSDGPRRRVPGSSPAGFTYRDGPRPRISRPGKPVTTFYAHHPATGTVLKGPVAWQVAERAQQLHLRRKDADLNLEGKTRHVRTPAGTREYHKPIGAVISGQDMPTALAGMLARSPDSRVRRAGAALGHAESPGSHPAATAAISKLPDADLDLLAGKVGEAAATDDPKLKGPLRAAALTLAAKHGLPRLAGLDVLSRLLWVERDRRTGKSLVEDLEVKVRHVRTPGGVRHFHKPLGSVIAPGDVYLHPETGSYLTVFEGAPGSTREHLRGLLYVPNPRGGMTPKVVKGVHSFADQHHLVAVPSTTDINKPGPTDRGGRNRHGVYLPGITLGDKIRTASGTHTVRHLHPNGDFGVSQTQVSQGGLARVSRHDVLEHLRRTGRMPPVTKSLDGLEIEDLGELELKVRKVKTPGGVRKYHKPIGTVISSSHADLSDRVAGAAMSGHDVFHIHGPEKHHKQVVHAVKRASAASHVPLAVTRTKKGWRVHKTAVPFAGAPAKRGARDFAALMAMFKNADLDLELKVRSWLGEPQQGSTRMPRSDTLEEDDRAPEVKVRHVRTASGARYYHEPIGAPIVGHPRVGNYRLRTGAASRFTGRLRVNPSGGGTFRYQPGHGGPQHAGSRVVRSVMNRYTPVTAEKPARQLPGSPAVLRNGKLPPGRYGVQIGGIQHVYIVRRGRVDDVAGRGELFDGQNRLADMPGLRHLGPIHGTATRARKREAQDRWKARHAKAPAASAGKPPAKLGLASGFAQRRPGVYRVHYAGGDPMQYEIRPNGSGRWRWEDLSSRGRPGRSNVWIDRSQAEVERDLARAVLILGNQPAPAKPAKPAGRFPAGTYLVTFPGQAHKQVEYRVDASGVGRWRDGQASHWIGPRMPALVEKDLGAAHIISGPAEHHPKVVRKKATDTSGDHLKEGTAARIIAGKKLPAGRYAIMINGRRHEYAVNPDGSGEHSIVGESAGPNHMSRSQIADLVLFGSRLRFLGSRGPQQGSLGTPARLVGGKLPVGRYAIVNSDGQRHDYVVHRNGDAAGRLNNGPAIKIPAEQMARIAQTAGPDLRHVGPLHRTASRLRRAEAAARFRAKKHPVDPLKPGKYVRADAPGLEYQVQQDGHVRVADRAGAKRGGGVGSYTLTPTQWQRIVQARRDNPQGGQFQAVGAQPAAAKAHALKPGWYQRPGLNGAHLEYHIHTDGSGTGYDYPAGHPGSAPVATKHYPAERIAAFIKGDPNEKFEPINGPRVGVAGPADQPKPGYYTLQMGGVHYAYDVHDDGKVFVVATDSNAAMARPVELDKAGQRDVWLHVAGQFQAAERPGPKVYHWQNRPSEQIILDPSGGAHAEVGGRQFPIQRSYAEARLKQHPDDWKLQAAKAKQVSGPQPGDTFVRAAGQLNILPGGAGQLIYKNGDSQRVTPDQVRKMLAGGDWKLKPQSGLSRDGQFHLPGLDRTAVGKPAGGVTGDATPIADDLTLQQILAASFNVDYYNGESVTDNAGNTWKVKKFGDDNSTSTFKVTGPDGRHYLLKHPDHDLGQPQSLQVEVAADLMARHAGYSDWPAGQIIMSGDTVTGVITEFVDNPKGYHLADNGWTNHLYDFPATDLLNVGIFDYVIDNTDRHLMNGGAVETPDGWHLIPFDNNLAMGYSNEGNSSPHARPGRATLEEFVDHSPPYAQGSWPLKDGNEEYDGGVRGVIMELPDREIIAAYDEAQRRWASVEMDSIPGIDKKQRAQVKQRIADLLTHRAENLRYLGVTGNLT